jgi:glutathione peroxidase
MHPNTVDSIYDIPLKSWDDKEDFLAKYKGKVTLIVNVTANCGNAPQLAPLEEIYQKYKDRGFEIAAIPTNDFCGPGITYDKWENGITCADDARTYALDTYQVTYDFSEMITSQVHEYWRKKRDNYRETHPLYEALAPKEFPMGGNFEKFLVDRDGKVVKRFPNYTLLDFYYENVKTGVYELKEGDPDPMTKEEAYEQICAAIEATL